MALYQVHPRELPEVWPLAAPLIQKAIDLDPTATTIQHVEYSIRTGKMFLLVWEEPGEGVTGACTVEFWDLPMERMAHVSLMGGKGIVRHHVFEEAKNWMRMHGATRAQCFAQGTLPQMYEKMGMENTHQVMRIKL